MTAEALSRIHSRYEAEAIISGCTVIEPRWLAAVFRRLGEQRGYLLDILNSPSGAPLLRQACETLPRRTIIDISARIRKECQHRDASVFDAETACLVVGIGNRASHARTCKIGLESLIRVISQSDKLLLEMVPTQILAECADGVVRYQKDLASSRAVFADLARARVGTFFRRQPGMIAHTWVRIEALIQFWRMGLPFEGEAKHFFEREAHRAFSMVMPYPNRAFDDLVLAIVRYARESDSDEVLRIFESGWRQGGRRSASSSHEDFSSAAEFFEILRRDERDLSPSQQSDLRWIIRKRDSARVSAPEGSKAD
jgi:hypothetical protein